VICLGANDMKQTEFNSSIQSLIRLDTLLTENNKYSVWATHNGANIKALNLWHKNLLAIRREISPKLERPEIIVIDKILKKFDNHSNIVIQYKSEEGLRSKINFQQFNSFYNLCDHLELWLRKYADRHGMLMSEKHYDDILSPNEDWSK